MAAERFQTLKSTFDGKINQETQKIYALEKDALATYSRQVKDFSQELSLLVTSGVDQKELAELQQKVNLIQMRIMDARLQKEKLFKTSEDIKEDEELETYKNNIRDFLQELHAIPLDQLDPTAKRLKEELQQKANLAFMRTLRFTFYEETTKLFKTTEEIDGLIENNDFQDFNSYVRKLKDFLQELNSIPDSELDAASKKEKEKLKNDANLVHVRAMNVKFKEEIYKDVKAIGEIAKHDVNFRTYENAIRHFLRELNLIRPEDLKGEALKLFQDTKKSANHIQIELLKQRLMLTLWKEPKAIEGLDKGSSKNSKFYEYKKDVEDYLVELELRIKDVTIDDDLRKGLLEIQKDVRLLQKNIMREYYYHRRIAASLRDVPQDADEKDLAELKKLQEDLKAHEERLTHGKLQEKTFVDEIDGVKLTGSSKIKTYVISREKLDEDKKLLKKFSRETLDAAIEEADRQNKFDHVRDLKSIKRQTENLLYDIRVEEYERGYRRDMGNKFFRIDRMRRWEGMPKIRQGVFEATGTLQKTIDDNFSRTVRARRQRTISDRGPQNILNALIPPLLADDIEEIRDRRDNAERQRAREEALTGITGDAEKAKRILSGVVTSAAATAEEATAGTIKTISLFFGWPIIGPVKIINAAFTACKYAFCGVDAIPFSLIEHHILGRASDKLFGPIETHADGSFKWDQRNWGGKMLFLALRSPFLICREVFQGFSKMFRWLEKHFNYDEWAKSRAVSIGFIVGGIGLTVFLGLVLASAFALTIPLWPLIGAFAGAALATIVSAVVQGIQTWRRTQNKDNLTFFERTQLEKYEAEEILRPQVVKTGKTFFVADGFALMNSDFLEKAAANVNTVHVSVAPIVEIEGVAATAESVSLVSAPLSHKTAASPTSVTNEPRSVVEHSEAYTSAKELSGQKVLTPAANAGKQKGKSDVVSVEPPLAHESSDNTHHEDHEPNWHT